MTLLLTLLLTLLGCRPPGAVRPTVKLGLIAPFEGRYRYLGYDVIYATRLALREVNLSGGVGGYGVELLAYDDSADPSQAVETARRLTIDPRLIAASGHYREETTAAALPVYAEAGLPLIAPLVLTEHPQAIFFRLGPTGDRLAEMLLERAAADGRPFALVSDGGPLEEALIAETARLGVSPAASVAPDGDDWLTTVLSSGAEAVICATPPVVAGEVLSALRSSGWTGEFLGGPELAAPAFAAIAGDLTDVAYISPSPPPPEGFAAAYRQISNGTPPGPFALPSYEATRLLLTALSRDIAAHEKPTRAGTLSALTEVMAELPPPVLAWR